MATHERDLFDTSIDHAGWRHPDDDAFTADCPGCEAIHAVLSIQVELRLAIRDLWIAGWAPTELADEIRHRTGSAGARDLIVHALVDEDAKRSEQAKTEQWTQEVTFLAAAAGVEKVALGWVAGWILHRDDSDAALAVVLDVLDVLQDMRLSVG
jgi:hypothetical protein